MGKSAQQSTRRDTSDNLFLNDYILLVAMLYYINATYLVLFNANKPSDLTLLIIRVRGHLSYL